MSDVLIKKYRGFNIHFNPDNERFYTEIDGTSWHQKQSYSAVVKFIDDYIKDNHVFKPFKIVQDGNAFTSSKEVTITGIRKDGRFIYEEKGKKCQISDYEEKNWFLHDIRNEKIFATVAILESEIDELQKKIKAEKNKLIKVTLESVKANYLPPQ